MTPALLCTRIFPKDSQMRFVHGWMSIAIVLASFGCSRTQVPLARLEGTVVYQGQPVEEGSISFSPLAGGKGVSAKIAQGRYLAEGVRPGPVRMQIIAFRQTGRTLTLDDVETPELASIVPDKLRAGLVIDVVRDRSDLDFNLSE